ncbi:DUF1415 domain-containing protein [Pseudomonas leptonychotis]|uniref:DUF1415 domain-containing protein n=1 Tax=Pseudomonas leptonychotis TaxID=2448482 RepID=A0A4T1ZTY2_9PSED|nr:DUF1415 domain-containing protein [Pseudomonas leptonychotis]TIH07527.1 DUF1415 domain-containing protein [Pseudomonas leptonychotis]
MPSTTFPSAAHAIAETRAWVDRAVIGLNLCPFAKAVQVKGQVRYAVCASAEPKELLSALIDELHALANCAPNETDTTLLIHPAALTDFLDFNDFLGLVDDTLDDLGYAGTLQVASFHPQFQFADTGVNDVSNATNRSPYPTLHILREASIDRAVAAFPDPEAIFEANIQTLENLGTEGWADLQAQCRRDAQNG